jgi:hypothetical protein
MSLWQTPPGFPPSVRTDERIPQVGEVLVNSREKGAHVHANCVLGDRQRFGPRTRGPITVDVFVGKTGTAGNQVESHGGL